MLDGEPPYRDRADAGRVLTAHLKQYKPRAVVVFAIPRGGVPVAVEVAKKLGLELDVIVSRKIPIPYNTEAGYGAVTEGGAIVLNEPLVERLGLTGQQIERHAGEVRAEIRRRQAIYKAKVRPSSVEGKAAIIIDDGLASGYTMMAATNSIRQQGATKVVAAAPVASSSAWELIKSVAEDVVCPIVSHHYPFAVASFYRHWHDLTDEEVIDALERFRKDSGGPVHD
jgi:putative phosphoribosyl transferase